VHDVKFAEARRTFVCTVLEIAEARVHDAMHHLAAAMHDLAEPTHGLSVATHDLATHVHDFEMRGMPLK
jgi:hypothetical protein